jgi:hypothetical protein
MIYYLHGGIPATSHLELYSIAPSCKFFQCVAVSIQQ